MKKDDVRNLIKINGEPAKMKQFVWSEIGRVLIVKHPQAEIDFSQVDNCIIIAKSFTLIKVRDGAKVEAQHDSHVIAGKNAHITVGDNSRAFAGESASILTGTDCHISAGKGSKIHAGANGYLRLKENTKFNLSEGCKVQALDGSHLSKNGCSGTINTGIKDVEKADYYYGKPADTNIRLKSIQIAVLVVAVIIVMAYIFLPNIGSFIF